MRIYGLDFTSAPSPERPIVVAVCELDGGALRVEDLLRIHSLSQLEHSLEAPGPWIAALDLPFGMPRKLIDNLEGWPRSWEGYVARFAALGRQEFEDLLETYKAPRSTGDKEHRRRTDVAAGAPSPMKLHGVSLAKMFLVGAPRLLASDCRVLPCRWTASDRIVVEAYPALVARSLIGRGRYKTEPKRKQTQAETKARRNIVAAAASQKAEEIYGLRVEIGEVLAGALVSDTRGDLLDAVLAAMQGAWSALQGPPGYGIPADADPDEGWIVDPATAEAPSG